MKKAPLLLQRSFYGQEDLRSHDGRRPRQDFREQNVPGKGKNAGNTLCIAEHFHAAWRVLNRKDAVGFSRSANKIELLDLDGSADSFELSLEGLGVFLGDAFLDLGGNAFDQLLGIGQAQAGDAADFLDDGELL